MLLIVNEARTRRAQVCHSLARDLDSRRLRSSLSPSTSPAMPVPSGEVRTADNVARAVKKVIMKKSIDVF